MDAIKRKPTLAAQGWVGLSLLLVCWPLNWSLPDETVRTAYLFTPLWLGYILTIDALVLQRTGSSLWTRSRRDFILLFVASAPVWWLFEAFNWRTKNWEYLGSGNFTVFEYYLLCTLCFSTVMPAIFETAELMRSFRWTSRFTTGPRIQITQRLCAGMFLTGLIMLALIFLFPRYCYPFIWTSLLLILEPANVWLRRQTLLDHLQSGNWRPVVTLSVGALMCGFFWEMWNYWSWPKWVYHTPGANYLHVYEMPLLGYGGYIPFSLELYALMHFLWPRSPQLRIT